MKTALKVILWSIMAIVLVIAATLICAVKILTPDRLTPIVERVHFYIFHLFQFSSPYFTS